MMKNILLIMILMSLVEKAKGAVSDWQGNWGSFTKTDKYLSGGVLRITDCDEVKKTCALIFESGRPVTTNRCQAGNEAYPQTLVVNDKEAEVKLLDLYQKIADCTIRLSLKDATITGKMEGGDCRSFCTTVIV